MKKPLFLLLLIFPMLLRGQGTGITFANFTTFTGALQQAKSDHRLIFIDVYTDWCGPCKLMDAEVFPVAAVGQLYNAKFINVKVDAEKGEGPALAKKYSVHSYPTYLFVNEEGTLIYRSNGSMEIAEFLRAGKNALTEAGKPETIVQLEEKYRQFPRDKTVAFHYLRRMTDLQLPTSALLDRYFTQLTATERAEPANIRLVVDNGTWLNKQLCLGPAFDALAANKAVLEQLKAQGLVPDDTFESVQTIARTGSLDLAIRKKDAALFRRLKALKSAPGESAFDNTLTIALTYYLGIHDLNNYVKTARTYIDDFLLKIPADTMEKKDAETFARMKTSINLENNPKYNRPEYINTYKHTYTIQISNQLAKISETLLRQTPGPATLQRVKNWSLKAVQIAGTDPDYYKDVSPFYQRAYAMALYRCGERDQAIQQMKQLLAPLPSSPQITRMFGDVLSQMEAGKSLSF